MSEPIDAYKKLIDTLAFEGYPRHLTEDLLDEITTAAVIEELRKLLELKVTTFEWGLTVCVDDIEERIARLEARPP